MSVEDEELVRIYEEWGREEKEALSENDPLSRDFEYRAFESRSNGRGRRRRKTRYVELVLDKREGIAVSLSDAPRGRIDAWAKEALYGQTADDEDEFLVFVNRLKALAALGTRR